MSREHSLRSLTSVVLAMTGALQTTDLHHEGGISNLIPEGNRQLGLGRNCCGTHVMAAHLVPIMVWEPHFECHPVSNTHL